MLVINEKEMQWETTPGSNLSLKNIVQDYRIGEGLMSGGVAKWPKGKAGEPHIHPDQDEIYIILRGRGIANLKGELRELGPGDMLHAKSGEVHGMVEGLTQDGVEMFFVLVPKEKKN